jgi:hypothetical protein
VRTTSRDYANPHRPAVLRVANRALGLALPRRLTVDGLVAAARRAEGLHDLGDPDVDVPLGRLLDAVEAEARLHPLGWLITRGRLIGVLRNRLRAQAALAADPAILDRPVREPVVVTGLQRTGTTFLHRLLAADPRFRSLRSWEGLNPTPFRGSPTGPADPRRRLAERAEKGLAWMAPDFFAVHPVEASAPEEEVLLLDHSFLSTVPEATLRVPSFSRWLERQDQRPAYVLLRRLLQLLDAAEPRERWVLKTPHHLEWLDVLLDVFPDARIVWTHRDPLATLGSFCSMVAHGRGVMSDAVDPREIGRDWLAKTARMIDRAMAVREARPAAFLDVRYDDLTRAPLAEVARVFAFADVPLPPDVEAAVAAQRDASPQHRHGRHVYALSDFGLTEGQVAERFSAYRERFGFV